MQSVITLAQTKSLILYRYKGVMHILIVNTKRIATLALLIEIWNLLSYMFRLLFVKLSHSYYPSEEGKKIWCKMFWKPLHILELKTRHDFEIWLNIMVLRKDTNVLHVMQLLALRTWVIKHVWQPAAGRQHLFPKERITPQNGRQCR